MTHETGAGLKIVSTRRWFGPGYCGICGHTDEKSRDSPLIPMMVRWWDPDDGWKSGVLCKGCGEDQRDRGPQEGDFAYKSDCNEKAEKIDVLASLGDEDAAYTESQDD